MERKSVAAARLAGLVLLVLAGSVVIPAASGRTFDGGPAANGGLPELLVLSNRADLVSGGNALVQVVLPARVDPSSVHVSLNGTDVTSAFAVRPGDAYEGVVTGLANGVTVGSGCTMRPKTIRAQSRSSVTGTVPPAVSIRI